MSDLDDSERRDMETILLPEKTRTELWNLGTAAFEFAMSQAEKSRLKNLEAELRTKKPECYLFHLIVGVTCPSCLSVTEEGQWCCHLCGAALTSFVTQKGGAQ